MNDVARVSETRPLTVFVDACVWSSRLFPQGAHHAASRRWFEAFQAPGGRMVAPVLLLPEIAGATSRRTGAPELAHRPVRESPRWRTRGLVAWDRRLAQAASQLAVDLGLRGADAAYVAIADQLKIPRLTWDDEHVEKAGRRVAVRMPDLL